MDIITLALCKRMGKSKADIDGVYPNLIAGGVVESEVRDEDFSNKVTEHTGTANINSIKGNTLVWNQLVQNGNFASTSGWGSTRGTITANNNICQLTATETGSFPQSNRINYPNITPLVNHTYLLSAYIKAPRNTVGTIGFTQADYWPSFNLQANVKTKISTIYTFSNVSSSMNLGIGVQANVNDVIEISNVQMFDLTQMGLDITDPSEFTSLFPLSYYDYNQGSLLSFNGNGIKTVGKNRFNKDTITLNSRIAENGQIYSSSASDLTDYIDVGAFDSVNFSWDYSSLISSDSRAYVKFDMGKNVVGFATYSPTSKSVSIDTSSCFYLRITLDKGMNDIQVENGQKTSYEPYTSSTLSLPISTYFPTGMKSAGNVYDELTPKKAITRIGVVDLGTLNWSYVSADRRFIAIISDAKSSSGLTVLENIVSAKYENATWENILTQAKDKIIALHYTSNNNYVAVIDNDYSDATTFKTTMSGVYLYYELATPTEADVNLDLSYKTYEGGTEQLLPENGSVPVTSPMKTNVEFDFDENINALLGKMLNMIAPVETSPTSNAYSVGQYLIYDYVLYKVTSAIASGGTITVGTNVEATTIASVLESL